MSEFDSPNYVEYSYEKKSEGKVKLERRLMIALYIVFGFGAAGALIGFQLYPVVAVVPVLVYTDQPISVGLTVIEEELKASS